MRALGTGQFGGREEAQERRERRQTFQKTFPEFEVTAVWRGGGANAAGPLVDLKPPFFEKLPLE